MTKDCDDDVSEGSAGAAFVVAQLVKPVLKSEHGRNVVAE